VTSGGGAAVHGMQRAGVDELDRRRIIGCLAGERRDSFRRPSQGLPRGSRGDTVRAPPLRAADETRECCRSVAVHQTRSASDYGNQALVREVRTNRPSGDGRGPNRKKISRWNRGEARLTSVRFTAGQAVRPSS